MQQHPSASVRSDMTLIPESAAVIAAVLRGSSVSADDLPGLIRGVHGALVDIALDSASVSGALDVIGYVPRHRGEDPLDVPVIMATAPAASLPASMTQAPAPVRARAPGKTPAPPARRAAPGAAPVPAPAPVEPPTMTGVIPFPAGGRSKKASAAPVPQTEPSQKVKEAPAASPPVRKVKARPVRMTVGTQLEMPIKGKPVPARGMSIADSVMMDHIRCLEDGKKVRDLSHHLAEAHGLSPTEYREKWGLPASYPMHPPGMTLKRGDQFEYEPTTGTFKRARG